MAVGGAVLVVATLMLISTLAKTFGKNKFAAGPYGIQLYDTPHHYPFYAGRPYTDSWDHAGRCQSYCRGPGCTVVCR
jgi:hypothetical protein